MTEKVVGLDLGATAVRGVELSKAKNGQYTVEKVGYAPLEPGLIEAGRLTTPDALTQTLKALWKTAKFSTKNVAFGLSNSDILVRQLDLPWMEPDDFKSALSFQVGDILPVPVDTVTLDYHPLGEFVQMNEDGKAEQMLRVLVVAGNTEVIDGFSDAILAAGLYPVRADIIPFALIRFSRPEYVSGCPLEAVVDLGGEITNVVVHQGGQPRFVRTLTNYGGNKITRVIQERFNVTWHQAEDIKAQVGLGVGNVAQTNSGSSVFGGQQGGGSQAQTHPALPLVGQWASGLIAEIRNSLDYGLSALDNAQLSRVVLTGGGARLNGIAARLQSELRVPVVVLNPLDGLGNKAKEAAVVAPAGASPDSYTAIPDLSVAVGLAIGA